MHVVTINEAPKISCQVVRFVHKKKAFFPGPQRGVCMCVCIGRGRLWGGFFFTALTVEGIWGPYYLRIHCHNSGETLGNEYHIKPTTSYTLLKSRYLQSKSLIHASSWVLFLCTNNYRCEFVFSPHVFRSSSHAGMSSYLALFAYAPVIPDPHCCRICFGVHARWLADIS